MSEHDTRPDATPFAEGDSADGTNPAGQPAAGIAGIGAWARLNRSRLEILAIAAVALGGIVCMCLATLLIVWRMSNE